MSLLPIGAIELPNVVYDLHPIFLSCAFTSMCANRILYMRGVIRHALAESDINVC